MSNHLFIFVIDPGGPDSGEDLLYRRRRLRLVEQTEFVRCPLKTQLENVDPRAAGCTRAIDTKF